MILYLTVLIVWLLVSAVCLLAFDYFEYTYDELPKVSWLRRTVMVFYTPLLLLLAAGIPGLSVKRTWSFIITSLRWPYTNYGEDYFDKA